MLVMVNNVKFLLIFFKAFKFSNCLACGEFNDNLKNLSNLYQHKENRTREAVQEIFEYILMNSDPVKHLQPRMKSVITSWLFAMHECG